MNCEYVREYYSVPAEIGRRVVAYGKPGVISEDRGNYIGVLLDKDNPGDVGTYHPTDGIEYLGMCVVRQKKMTQSQRRYQEYKRSAWYEAGDSFATFLGITEIKM